MPKSYLLFYFLVACVAPGQTPDWRNITSGSTIPGESYADQPYIVKTDDGAWLAVLTTGKGLEGAGAQHVISTRSLDRGKTWEKPIDVEPADGPEASYAVLLKVPSGRVYVFYNHNTDNIRQVIGDKPVFKDGFNRRVDTLGHFVFKYSDDHGRSWSQKRYEIPQRDFEIDRKNPYGGKLKFFWNVGRAFAYKGAGYVPLHKVGGFGEGFITSSEGVLLRSANLLTERDPDKITWETLPDGDIGIRTPPGGGPIAEEQSFSVMSDGSLFCVFRTIDGHAAFTYSRDGGRSWDPSQYMRFADGRLMKHPRAATFAWRCENGKYLNWLHNHGGRFIREHPNRRTIAHQDRNPAWLSGGVEVDSPKGKIIRWSQPEIALYDDDPVIHMSYPDLVEERGDYFLTETQKNVARVHKLDRALVEGLWSQFDPKAVAPKGAILQLPVAGQAMPASFQAPALPQFLRQSRRPDFAAERLNSAVSIELWLRLRSIAPGQVLLDNRTPEGKGFLLRTAPDGALEIVLSDGRTENHWSSDPGTINQSKLQHVVVIVDGGPNIISFVIDGKLCDGGDARQFGWGRFSPNLISITGSPTLRIAPGLDGQIEKLRMYNRYLRTSEAIALFHAGL